MTPLRGGVIDNAVDLGLGEEGKEIEAARGDAGEEQAGIGDVGVDGEHRHDALRRRHRRLHPKLRPPNPLRQQIPPNLRRNDPNET